MNNSFVSSIVEIIEDFPFVVITSILILGLSAGFFSGYEFSQSTTYSQNDPAVNAVVAELEGQRRVLENNKELTQDHLDALALKLGVMQSQLIRLDALGGRLVKLGGLSTGEFDFGQEPAQGGRVDDAPGVSLSLSDMLFEMTLLSSQLDDRKDKLSEMEQVLMQTEISHQVMPAGKPIESGYISSRYGYRTDPFNGRRKFHHGVDLAAKRGSRVVAVASGMVIKAKSISGYGKIVEIKHADGFVTKYGHNHQIYVESGDLVTRGQVIGSVGSSGRSTGPHVHFEVALNGRTVNPSKYLKSIH